MRSRAYELTNLRIHELVALSE